jgi:hypothetical protein
VSLLGPRSKRDTVTGEWRRLHHEGLNDLISSSNIIRVIKSRRMRLGEAYSMYRGEVYTEFWWGKMMENNHLEDSSVEGRIILKWIFNKWDGEHGLD